MASYTKRTTRTSGGQRTTNTTSRSGSKTSSKVSTSNGSGNSRITSTTNLNTGKTKRTLTERFDGKVKRTNLSHTSGPKTSGMRSQNPQPSWAKSRKTKSRIKFKHYIMFLCTLYLLSVIMGL